MGAWLYQIVQAQSRESVTIPSESVGNNDQCPGQKELGSKPPAPGFSESMLKEVYDRLKPYFTDTCPFTPRPKANAPDPVGKA
jgi:hypothetical protein